MQLKRRIEQDYSEFLKTDFLLSNHESIDKVSEQFNKIYILNFLRSRIENKKIFDTDYYEVTHSCLVESFLLFSQNYLRASSLVLRSSIENYLKNILNIHNIDINQRVYIENRNAVEIYINQNVNSTNRKISLTKLNDKLLTQYKNLSGLSHSLTKDSKNLTINFTSDISKLSNENLSKVHKHFADTLDIMIVINLILAKNFLSHWSYDELNTFLRIVMGNKKAARMIKIIKKDDDLLFHF